MNLLHVHPIPLCHPSPPSDLPLHFYVGHPLLPSPVHGVTRPPVAVDAQAGSGFGSSPIPSYYRLPSKCLVGRSEKAPIFGELLYPNRMVSDVMDHPIRFIFRCLLGWLYDSKLSSASNISNGCCSSH
uniref:Uncharacterized protein n=1 Tax=Fagus sylvatica TaxID=28930 RepID=A0A2N9J4E4_FAGSY